jgi:diguanylate cyclase (GGDEF)-like protein
VEILDRARRALNFDADALADYRDRIGKHLCGMAAGLLSPFFILHVVDGHRAMASVNFVLIAVLWVNARSLRQGRRPPVPFWALACLLIAGICASVLLQGVAGVLWAFPALIMCFFLLPRRLAMVLSLVLVAAVTIASGVSIGMPLALRVFAAMALVLPMINVVLNVIGDLQRNLVEQATTDPLTGAYNRRHLQSHLQQLVVPAEAARPMDSLLAIDIDHFKQVNDRYGHAVGDTVLCGVVATIGARKRSSDLLFRTGGEEFMLLLPRASSHKAMQIAEELRLRLAQAALLPDQPVTVSIGVSTLRAGQCPQDWASSADKALYEAKRAGRNRVVLAAEDGAGSLI